MALAKMKAVSNKMAFMRSDYNSLGVLTATPKEKQVLIIDADTDAYLAVLGYSTLFNLEPAKVQYRVIVVDEIPIQDTHAILIDEDFYAVWDALQKFTRDMNGKACTGNIGRTTGESWPCARLRMRLRLLRLLPQLQKLL